MDKNNLVTICEILDKRGVRWKTKTYKDDGPAYCVIIILAPVEFDLQEDTMLDMKFDSRTGQFCGAGNWQLEN